MLFNILNNIILSFTIDWKSEMFKNCAKDLAHEVLKLSEDFTKLFNLADKDYSKLQSISLDAQSKITEMFNQIRTAEDHKEVVKDLGKSDQLGYFFEKEINGLKIWQDFIDNKTLEGYTDPTLRDCANCKFHWKDLGFKIEQDIHWLMFYSDRKNLVIMDIQKVCRSIISNF